MQVSLVIEWFLTCWVENHQICHRSWRRRIHCLYTFLGIMADTTRSGRFQFLVTEGAKGDLHECRGRDAYAAAKISELLRLVIEDELAAEALVDERQYDDAIESICPLWSLQDKRIN